MEATELGSGFAIAMKDLEIRGAGNLLGVKQSGHIAALGFDLYCQLLAEAVEELKGKQVGEVRASVIASEAKQSPAISLPLDAHIPEEYVPNLNTRLSLYHRLARVEGVEEMEDVAREFQDRFGPLPEPVENLLYMVKIRVLAMKAEVSSIATEGRQIAIRRERAVIASVAKQSLDKKYDSAIKIGATQIKLDTRLLGDRWKAVLEEILGSDCA
jgi:transcription-repair coupling factor (superfamily II helicase)